MENVYVVEKMINHFSKSKVWLQMTYSFAAPSFPWLIAEPVPLLGLPGRYRTSKPSHQRSDSRFYSVYDFFLLFYINIPEFCEMKTYPLQSCQLINMSHVPLVYLERRMRRFSITFSSAAFHQQLRYVRKSNTAASKSCHTWKWLGKSVRSRVPVFGFRTHHRSVYILMPRMLPLSKSIDQTSGSVCTPYKGTPFISPPSPSDWPVRFLPALLQWLCFMLRDETLLQLKMFKE